MSGKHQGLQTSLPVPRRPGGASTQPQGDGGSDGAGGGHGHKGPGGHGTGEPGLGTDSGDRGTPLGAAPSRPATAARPYRDFLGVLFAVGGQHPSRGAPPCGLPQLVVTGRKAVFLRGGGNPEESPIPFLPTLPKAVPAPTSSAQRAVERLWILPECRITLSKRSATESRRQPLSPGAHTAGGAAARTSSHSSASAAPGPAESGGRRGPVPAPIPDSLSPSSPACPAALARAIPLRIPVPGASRRGAAPRPLYRASGVCAAGAGGCWGAPPLSQSGPGCPPRAGTDGCPPPRAAPGPAAFGNGGSRAPHG